MRGRRPGSCVRSLTPFFTTSPPEPTSGTSFDRVFAVSSADRQCNLNSRKLGVKLGRSYRKIAPNCCSLRTEGARDGTLGPRAHLNRMMASEVAKVEESALGQATDQVCAENRPCQECPPESDAKSERSHLSRSAMCGRAEKRPKDPRIHRIRFHLCPCYWCTGSTDDFLDRRLGFCAGQGAPALWRRSCAHAD
jgi:hypothetical protein